MREALYRQVDAEYARMREENLHAQEARRDEARAADPRVGELLDRRSECFLEAARAAFRDPANALERSRRLKETIAAINAELARRLAALGLPDDYLQPRYHCPLCRDTGFVGEPIKSRCECFMRRVRQLSVACEGAGVDPRETFAAYRADVYPDTPLEKRPGQSQRQYMELVRARCQSYVDSFPFDSRRNLLFLGAAGLGKTFLMNCIGNALTEKGVAVLKLTSYQLTDRMRAAIFEHNWDAFAAVLDAPVLLLDDLGAEPLINNVTIEQLFTLLNERELNALHTVVSTNLMTDELKRRYTERICSRLFDRRVTSILPFYGEDVRLKGAP